ncbi:MAG: glycosyltransferase family 4 protein, partial [Candidatus Omnitrophica bacterium]|nr:glycosyltransferase family 4 protein [Candidatus Omnitrophota bacterium]
CAKVKVIIYTPHGHVFYGYFSRLLTGTIVVIEKILSHITDAIVGLTPDECKEWLRFDVGKPDQYKAIPSGIDFTALEKDLSVNKEWRKVLGIPQDGILIGSVGRFIEIKGYGYLISAAGKVAAKNDKAYFLIAGDGPLVNEYRRMINLKKLEKRFFILPWQENAASIIKEFDIFVLPSLNEGMGRVLAEAMYLGKPVIGTRVGGVPSVITGDVGMLVEPSSSDAISTAIGSLIKDPGRMKKYGENGRAKAIKDYSVQKMVEELDFLYKKLLETKRG